MAAIGKIRSWGPVLITILAIALLGFIAETAFETLGKKKQMDGLTAGVVDGEKVDIHEFNQLVEEYQQLLKLQGQADLNEDGLNNLRDYIWNNYVRNKAIEKEAAELGLMVTDEEFKNVLTEGTNPSLRQIPLIREFVNPQTGLFDYTQVNTAREYLKQASQQAASLEERQQALEQSELIERCWPVAEKMLRQQLLMDKYQALLMGCVSSNPVSAQAAFNNVNEESKVLLAALPYASVNDNDIEVSDADIKAKYDEMKNAYKTYENTRDVKYVAFQVLPSQEDRDKLMETMREAYVAFSKDSVPASDVVRAAQSQVPFFGLPVTRAAMSYDIAARVDSMSVGQVVGPFENTGDNTFNVVKLINKVQAPDSVEFRAIALMGIDPAIAEKTADSICQALKAGAVFDTIAKKYGQTGDKAWRTSANYQSFQNIDMDNRLFYNTLFTLPQGEIKNLKLSQGNMVVQVTDRKAIVPKYDVAVVKRTINFSSDTHTKAYNQFSQFVSESQDIDGLVAKAAEYGYIVRDRQLTTADHNIAGLHRSNEAVRWIFSKADEGELSEVMRCGNDDYLLVVGLEKINPEGYADANSKREELKQLVMRDKKFAQLAEKFNGVNSIDAARSVGAQVDTVDLITFAVPASIRSLGTTEPALSGAVAAVDKGQFSKVPVKGQQAAYLFQVLDRHGRENVQYDAKSQEDMLRQQAIRQVMSIATQDLIRSIKVEDFRYNFF
ncbi:MAG: SurA N-terminal domain-containing protein [Prevotella sp.]|nr:SurA N-terminal domain-containing protein [Prevotella sp.]